MRLVCVFVCVCGWTKRSGSRDFWNGGRERGKIWKKNLTGTKRGSSWRDRYEDFGGGISILEEGAEFSRVEEVGTDCIGFRRRRPRDYWETWKLRVRSLQSNWAPGVDRDSGNFFKELHARGGGGGRWSLSSTSETGEYDSERGKRDLRIPQEYAEEEEEKEKRRRRKRRRRRRRRLTRRLVLRRF